MSVNPYESPQPAPLAIGVKSGTRADVRAVAQYQKGIMVCILIYIIAVISQFMLPENLRILVGFGVLLNGVVGLVFVFLLSTKVYSTGVGILLAILTVVPCLGLLVLLIINAKATTILRQNGLRVGLMGADTSQI